MTVNQVPGVLSENIFLRDKAYLYMHIMVVRIMELFSRAQVYALVLGFDSPDGSLGGYSSWFTVHWSEPGGAG